MRKLLITVSAVALLTTGCTTYRIDPLAIALPDASLCYVYTPAQMVEMHGSG